MKKRKAIIISPKKYHKLRDFKKFIERERTYFIYALEAENCYNVVTIENPVKELVEVNQKLTDEIWRLRKK